MMLGGIGLALGFFWNRHISQEERKIEGCLASYFHFKNLYPEAHFWYDPSVKIPKKWNDAKPRNVKYVKTGSKPEKYVVFFEISSDPNEESMNWDLGKNNDFTFLTITFKGSDYRIEDNPYGRESWLELGGDSVLEYANERNYIKNETQCPRWLFKELLEAKSWKLVFGQDDQETPSIRAIHFFTMPPLKQLKAEGLVRDAGKLPKEFFSVLKETVKAEGPSAGLIVISPVADSSVDYEGVVFPKPKSALGTGRFEYSGTWPWHRDPPSMFFPQHAEYKYVRPKWIVFENPCMSLLETLSNPLFDMHDFNDAMHLLVDLHLAWKYFELGSIYYFENTGKDVEFTRLK